MPSKKLKISDLSQHLFWDTDPESLDTEKNKRTIIHMVLQYGLINDWIMIYKYYGISEIVSETKKIRDLDDKTLSFISALSKTPKEEFLCYTIKLSTPKHWNF